MAKLKPQRCGNCLHWKGNPRSPQPQICNAPVPDAPIVSEAYFFRWPPNSSYMDRADGSTCKLHSFRPEK